MNGFMENYAFWSALAGLLAAQILKPLLSLIVRKGWNWRLLFTTGGMPSSHTSTVIAMTSSIAITEGFSSPLFTICLVFSLIIMSDAMNVRYETGKQAEILNEWSEIFSEMHKNGPFSPQNFKTMVGHSAFQVLAGLGLGLVTGIGTTYFLKGF